jgi:hypothetical protein
LYMMTILQIFHLILIEDTFNLRSDPYQPGNDVQVYVSETDPNS